MFFWVTMVKTFLVKLSMMRAFFFISCRVFIGSISIAAVCYLVDCVLCDQVNASTWINSFK